jgi:hypothetical protein
MHCLLRQLLQSAFCKPVDITRFDDKVEMSLGTLLRHRGEWRCSTMYSSPGHQMGWIFSFKFRSLYPGERVSNTHRNTVKFALWFFFTPRLWLVKKCKRNFEISLNFKVFSFCFHRDNLYYEAKLLVVLRGLRTVVRVLIVYIFMWQISTVGSLRFLLLRMRQFSPVINFSSRASTYLSCTWQSHSPWLHPQQKFLSLCAAGGSCTHAKCMKVTMDFVEWVVSVSIRWAVRTDDHISTLSVFSFCFHNANISYIWWH